jgi:filamentous hemagglutinin family protein
MEQIAIAIHYFFTFARGLNSKIDDRAMLQNTLHLFTLAFNSNRLRWFLTFCLAFGFWYDRSEKGIAQVAPDATLPNNSIVDTNNNSIDITGGTTAGTNLFHSFSTFSVPTNFRVSFLNNSAIQNIITRVTGGSLSEIDGLLQANGTANLILINPNGIIFGSNAALNLGGSFLATTANSIKFGDGSEFLANNLVATSILSVNVPIGLQFGSNNGEIAVRGDGNNLIYDARTSNIIKDFRNLGLQVNSGQTIALVGGNISLIGGNLTAFDGNIELGAVSDSVVEIIPFGTGWTFNYDNASILGDIQLVEAASLDASGNSGGTIRVNANRLLVSDASAILADTLGNGTGGNIRLQVTESIEVVGFSPNPAIPFLTYISTDVAPNATGKGGSIDIATNSLFVGFGGQISSGTFGSGDAGSITIDASEIVLTSGSPVAGGSGLFAPVAFGATGNGGRIDIDTQNLIVSDGAQVVTTTFGFGSAGQIDIRGQVISIVGNSPSGLPSTIASNVIFGNGKSGSIEISGGELIISGGSIDSTTDSPNNAGNILIRVNKLAMDRGGRIFTRTFGIGSAGNIDIDARTIELIGTDRPINRSPQTTISSAVFNTAFNTASGNGGNITIETDNISLVNGAQIAVATNASGNSGTLIIDATESINLSGSTDRERTGLFASAIVGTGNGGEILLNTNKLSVTDGAIVSTSNFASIDPNIPPGKGAAGNLRLNGNVIVLDNGGLISADVAFGDKGNIFIDTDRLLLAGESQISTNALETATGGNINIKAGTIVAFENSDITANATNNFAGQVTIDSQGIFGTKFAENLTPASDITASSDLGVSFSGIVIINTPDVDPVKGSIELSSNPLDVTGKIVSGCSDDRDNTLTVGGGSSLPETPYNIVSSFSAWRDLRGENSNIDSQMQTNNNSSDRTFIDTHNKNKTIVEARSIIKNTDGTFSLSGDDRKIANLQNSCEIDFLQK